MANILDSLWIAGVRNYRYLRRNRTFGFRGKQISDAVKVCDKPHYLFFSECFPDLKEKIQLASDMKVLDDFVTEDEENSLLQEVEPELKKLRYEIGHWDNAIKCYREREKLKWNSVNTRILENVKKIAFDHESVPLKHVHVLDLEENGVILPHIDSIKFCGTTIAGISLLSDSVMRLVHDVNKSKIVDVFLRRRSLYIMTGVARYLYTHEILGTDNSRFRNEVVKKGRRISIICRNEP
ncbi:hypothetical protein RUM44_005824 [Polyplax serrata]|uniref:Uncharacterized protein n=1 Tax=Polyplax serrata TaxID=468196 RepID=A0ABR1AY58_POLSC